MTYPEDASAGIYYSRSGWFFWHRSLILLGVAFDESQADQRFPPTSQSLKPGVFPWS